VLGIAIVDCLLNLDCRHLLLRSELSSTEDDILSR